jgi:predicted transcriptional regulator
MSKDPSLQTISVNLPRELVRRVQSLGFHEELSASSIVEQALLMLMDGSSEVEIAQRLRALGATLRRT